MHKILVTELSPAKGHADLFHLVSQILSKNENLSVDILAPLGSNISVSGCSSREMPYGYHEDPWAKNRFFDLYYRLRYEIKIAQYIGKISKGSMYSALFVVTYNEQSLPLGIKYLSHFSHIFIIHNNNIDHIIEKSSRRFFFNLFSKKVCHVVLADFIKEFMIKTFNLNSSNILTLPTPFSPSINVASKRKDIDCLGISNGNDEYFILNLIKKEETSAFIRKKGLHIVLKSSNCHYDDGYLTIIKGFLPRNIFEDYVSRAKVMLIPFPLTYKFRMSGTFIDAFSHGIPVIATPVPFVKRASKVYPEQIKLLKENSFVDDVQALSSQDDKYGKDEFDRFRKIHSVDYLSETFANSLLSIVKGGEYVDYKYDI